MSDCRICCRSEGESQGRDDGSPDPGCSCLRFPAAGRVPVAFWRGGDGGRVCVFSRKSFLGAFQSLIFFFHPAV